jgi:phenylalanine-4-hydroxylase
MISRLEIPPELADNSSLAAIGIVPGELAEISWISGVSLKGKVLSLRRSPQGALLMIRFSDAELRFGQKIYFTGTVFNLAIGARIISVHSGAADRAAFKDIAAAPAEPTTKVIYDLPTRRLQQYYQEVRDIRSAGSGYERLRLIFQTIKDKYPDDWLLTLEIYELLKSADSNPEFTNEVQDWLVSRALVYPAYTQLINNGMQLIDKVKQAAI